MARALVLGGGGPAGIGWQAGLLVGLGDAGVDLRTADLLSGTSAGSAVGALAALGWDLEESLALLDTSWPAPEAVEGPSGMELVLHELTEAASGSSSAEELRRNLGRISLTATTFPEAAYLGLFAGVEGQTWPARFQCTAVDVETGAPVVWDAGAGVPLQLAVASSCSVPGIFPPVTIGGRRYMDGGMKTALNADVVAGHDTVVAISCFALELPEGFSDPLMDMLNAAIQAELDAVRAAGSDLAVVAPGPEFLDLSGWGLNVMDPSLTREAFAVGRRQAADEVGRLGGVWGAEQPAAAKVDEESRESFPASDPPGDY